MKLTILVVALFACLLGTTVAEGGLTVLNLDRTIDIASQLVQIVNKIKVENTESAPAKEFVFTVDPELTASISFVEATTKGDNTLKHKVAPIAGKDNVAAYKIELPSPLEKGKSIELEVEVILTHYLKPFPIEITQKEKQLVKFVGNHYVYSPYKIVKQTTKVTLPSRNVENFTKLKPFSQSDTTISFGPYENIAPFSSSELTIHCENNSPFLTVTRLERTIEVSHWGNIAVEEKIDIVHTGAKLKVIILECFLMF
jgi:oligosaccharyltransferase complex subunit alpha (ribophorin I)